MVSDRRGLQKAAHLTAWMPRTGEVITAVIDTFAVRVGVTPDEPPVKEVVEKSFPIAVEIAEPFMVWVRTRGGQYWLPRRHEGVETAGLYGRLVLHETYEEVSPEARWFPGHALMARRPDEAIAVEDLDEIVAATDQGVDPPPEDMLLADALATVTASSTAMWKYERRDTARAVLLAAIAAEVKIKGTMRRGAPDALRELIDIVLDNPRDVSIATGQLLDKPLNGSDETGADGCQPFQVTVRLRPKVRRGRRHTSRSCSYVSPASTSTIRCLRACGSSPRSSSTPCLACCFRISRRGVLRTGTSSRPSSQAWTDCSSKP